jgi:hypothetical protein
MSASTGPREFEIRPPNLLADGRSRADLIRGGADWFWPPLPVGVRAGAVLTAAPCDKEREARRALAAKALGEVQQN